MKVKVTRGLRNDQQSENSFIRKMGVTIFRRHLKKKKKSRILASELLTSANVHSGQESLQSVCNHSLRHAVRLVTELMRREISLRHIWGCWVVCSLWLVTSTFCTLLSSFSIYKYLATVITSCHCSAQAARELIGLGNWLFLRWEKWWIALTMCEYACVSVGKMKAAIVPACSQTCPPVD